MREFVQAGGGLVVTHRTGLRDDQFQERQNFLLAELMGVDFLEKPDLATSFIVVGEGDRSEGFFAGVNPEMPYFEVHDAQCYVKPRDGTRSLGKVARPRRPYMEDGFAAPGRPPVMQLIDPKEIRQANAGYLYAPEIVTEHPAVTLNQYGKGRVAYLAAYPAYDYVDDVHDLIMALVNWAAGGKLQATGNQQRAWSCTEIITMEQLKQAPDCRTRPQLATKLAGGPRTQRGGCGPDLREKTEESLCYRNQVRSAHYNRGQSS